MGYHCQPFDLNDKELIERAHATGAPPHVAQAVKAAITGFRARMRRLPPPPVVDSELVIHVINPRNYFDQYVINTVIQEICDATGMGAALVKSQGPPNIKQPASPEVEFIPPDRDQTVVE